MSYDFEIKPELLNKLKKMRKKNFVFYKRFLTKINEIIKNPHHYKPLRYRMKGIWRIHFGPFVLTFTINEKEKLVEFLDIEHHDKAY